MPKISPHSDFINHVQGCRVKYCNLLFKYGTEYLFYVGALLLPFFHVICWYDQCHVCQIVKTLCCSCCRRPKLSSLQIWLIDFNAVVWQYCSIIHLYMVPNILFYALLLPFFHVKCWYDWCHSCQIVKTHCWQCLKSTSLQIRLIDFNDVVTWQYCTWEGKAGLEEGRGRVSLLWKTTERRMQGTGHQPADYTEHIIYRGIFFMYVLYSTLLHHPPLRFPCVCGCWDRTQDSCDFGIGCQTL